MEDAAASARLIKGTTLLPGHGAPVPALHVCAMCVCLPAAGTFATTYKGTYGGQAVAVKVLTAGGNANGPTSGEADAERCFFREAQLLRRCTHK